MKHYLSHNAFVQPSSRLVSRRHPSRVIGRVAPAFTLVEMLVVISIITVLLTIGTMGLRNMSKASGVGAGIPVAEAIFAEARSLAVGKGTRTRVLIHATEDHANEYHRERYLRYMAIQYDADGDPSTNDWVLASKGVSLPKGVYFMEDLCDKESRPSINTTTEAVELPGNSLATCYYYEFNAEGMLSNPASSNDPLAPDYNKVPAFVIVSGSLPPGQPEPIISGSNMGGFVIWRTGRTSVFRHPDQIDPNFEPK